MNFRPINDNVLCLVKEKQASGKLILTTANEFEIEVVAVSDGIDIVKVGDIIVAQKYAGLDIELEGVPYKILNVKEIVVVKG